MILDRAVAFAGLKFIDERLVECEDDRKWRRLLGMLGDDPSLQISSFCCFFCAATPLCGALAGCYRVLLKSDEKLGNLC